MRESENKRMKMEDEELISRFFPKLESKNKKADVKFQVCNGGKKRRRVDKVTKRTVFTSAQYNIMKREGICYYFQDNNCKKGKSCQFKHIKC